MQVLDVLQCRFSRVALLTDRHIAYLYARQQHTGDGDAGTAEAYTFKVKWFLPIHQIDNIRAVDKSLRITIDYRKPFSVSGLILRPDTSAVSAARHVHRHLQRADMCVVAARTVLPSSLTPDFELPEPELVGSSYQLAISLPMHSC